MVLVEVMAVVVVVELPPSVAGRIWSFVKIAQTEVGQVPQLLVEQIIPCPQIQPLVEHDSPPLHQLLFAKQDPYPIQNKKTNRSASVSPQHLQMQCNGVHSI